jgi:hypothetical protein
MLYIKRRVLTSSSIICMCLVCRTFRSWIIWAIFSKGMDHLNTNSWLRKSQIEKRVSYSNSAWCIYYRNIWHVVPTLLVWKKKNTESWANFSKVAAVIWLIKGRSDLKTVFRFELNVVFYYKNISYAVPTLLVIVIEKNFGRVTRLLRFWN